MEDRSRSRRSKPTNTPTASFSFSSSSCFSKSFLSSMARKSVLKQTLGTFVVVLVMYVFLNTFFHPTDNAKLDSTFPFNSGDSASVILNDVYGVSSPKDPVVKVFLYDLPRRFTYGVIEHHSMARGGRPVDDDSTPTYPGHQHMAEWYLFSDLLRPESERVGSPIVKAIDPDEADLFYVPFFSSLSLIVNPIRPAGSDSEKPAYSDEANQVALVEWLEGQEYWKRNQGRDHVIIASDPNALYKVIDRVKNSVLLLSDFGRLRPDQGSLVKDVIVPYSHRIRTYEGDVGLDDRGTLLFFMGNRYRKEVNFHFPDGLQ